MTKFANVSLPYTLIKKSQARNSMQIISATQSTVRIKLLKEI